MIGFNPVRSEISLVISMPTACLSNSLVLIHHFNIILSHYDDFTTMSVRKVSFISLSELTFPDREDSRRFAKA
jgi:hypothetical protein